MFILSNFLFFHSLIFSFSHSFIISFSHLHTFWNVYLCWHLIASEHISLYGDVAELANAVEASDVACRTDVDAPAIVEQLVAADEDVAHEVVAVETRSSVAVGEVVEDADVTSSLNADAVISAVLHDVSADDLPLAFSHRIASVRSVSEARLVLDENAVVAATHTDAVGYDEVLVVVATQPDADAAASAFAFSPVPTTFYHANIIYKYAIEEIDAKRGCRRATQHEVVEDSVRKWSDVEGFAIGGVGGRLHAVSIDGEMLETNALDGREVALLRALAHKERPIARANHLQNGALHGDALHTNLRAPMNGRAEDVFSCSQLNRSAAFGVHFIDKSLESLRVVPHLRSHEILCGFVNGCVCFSKE